MRITPRLPGVDRAQRLRPRHHADRAVRVDDRDDDLPAQPRAGQAPRRAAGAARHPARRPERRHAPSLRFRLAGAADRAGRRSRRRRPRSARRARPATSRSSSRSTRTSRSRRPGPPPTSLQRGGQVKDVGVADGEARPQGADQLAVRQPAAGRRRALPRLRGAARAAAACRSTSTPRRPAAPASTPRTRRCAGRSPRGRRPTGREATVLEDLTGGFNYGSGTVELAAARRARPSTARAGSALHWLRCRIDGSHALGRASAELHAPARDLLDHAPAPIGALLPAAHAVAASSARCSATSDGTPGQLFPLRYAPVLKPTPAETLEVSGPRVAATGRAGSCAIRSPRAARVRPPLRARRRPRRRRARPGDPRDRRRLAAVRRACRRRAPCCASRLPPRRRARAATSRRGTLTVLKSAIPGVDTVTNPAARPAASTPRRSRHARSARRWRSAPATARSPPRTSSSSRGEASPRVARAVCLPVTERQHPACCIVPAHRRPPTGCSRRTS